MRKKNLKKLGTRRKNQLQGTCLVKAQWQKDLQFYQIQTITWVVSRHLFWYNLWLEVADAEQIESENDASTLNNCRPERSDLKKINAFKDGIFPLPDQKKDKNASNEIMNLTI